MLASRYSGRISRDGVLRIKGRAKASEVVFGKCVEEKERASRGGLWRKRSKLLWNILKAFLSPGALEESSDQQRSEAGSYSLRRAVVDFL